MSTGTESRGIFSLRDNAQCVDFFLLFLSQVGACVISEENQCDTEESHDRQACKMAKERTAFQKPNHTGGRQLVRRSDKAHKTSGRARNIKANGKISLSRWMRSGQSETKDEWVDQELQRKRQKRIRNGQDGRYRRVHRKKHAQGRIEATPIRERGRQGSCASRRNATTV